MGGYPVVPLTVICTSCLLESDVYFSLNHPSGAQSEEAHWPFEMENQTITIIMRPTTNEIINIFWLHEKQLSCFKLK